MGRSGDSRTLELRIVLTLSLSSVGFWNETFLISSWHN